MSTDSKFYTLLESFKYQETLDFLVHNQTSVTLKINLQHFKTQILGQKNPKELSLYRFNFQKYVNEKIICSFEIQAEQYFFTSDISLNGPELILNIPTEIFQLQRREDFRVTIPMNTNYTCSIRLIDGRPFRMDTKIRDLSLSGCQLVVDPTEFRFKKETEICFNLRMHNLDREHILCSVQHMSSLKNNSQLLLGVKFKSSSADFLTDLQGLLVQLDRIHRGRVQD